MVFSSQSCHEPLPQFVDVNYFKYTCAVCNYYNVLQLASNVIASTYTCRLRSSKTTRVYMQKARPANVLHKIRIMFT